jgi:hypothetical protein
VWYQQKDQPVIRQDLGCFITDYNNIEEIDQIKMQKNNWYVINSQILHGVESMTRDRITVQIGLWTLDNIKSDLLSR